LLEAIRDGCALITWDRDTFAYADSYDESAGRYRGLRGGKQVMVSTDAGLLVKPEVARSQMDAEVVAVGGLAPFPATVPGVHAGGGEGPVPSVAVITPTRYHATVKLDPARPGA